MEQVFAPWRIEWVNRGDEYRGDDGCVFCQLPGRDDDREHRVVAKGEHAYVLLNNYPYNPGHAMVIPYTHTGAYESLDAAPLLGHARLQQRVIDALRIALEPDGFNVGMNLGRHAGGSIRDHLHTHIVPRWSGDTNFMPVISDTKVIVEALEDTYDRLHAALARQDGVSRIGPGQAVVVDG